MTELTPELHEKLIENLDLNLAVTKELNKKRENNYSAEIVVICELLEWAKQLKPEK